MKICETSLYSVELLTDRFVYHRIGSSSVPFSLPVLPIEGAAVALRADTADIKERVVLKSGATETTVSARDERGYLLTFTFRTYEGNPILKYSFTVHSEGSTYLTKGDGAYLSYIATEGYTSLTEVRFAEYNRLIHSFVPTEALVDPRLYKTGAEIMGPMLLDTSTERTLMLAYEHGSQHPDKYLAFSLNEDSLDVRGIKGNYYNGQRIDSEAFESIVFQIGVFLSDEAPSEFYRSFQLKYATNNAASREPYIFYNTWGMQERDRWYNGNPYLNTMNEERILKEIDLAHEMGIDVFVIDTGWYALTGDWKVNRDRFPNGFDRVNARLAEYSMKLGLWFNPRAVAAESDTLAGYEGCIMEWRGKKHVPRKVWETPESYNMCLVSR